MNLNQEKELFNQIAHASELFTTADIQYFFEVVVPQLDESDEDGSFIECYKIAQETNHSNFDMLTEFFENDLVAAISHLTHDTAFYNLCDENDCAELAKHYQDDEDTIGEFLKSDATDYAKKWLLKEHEPRGTTLRFLKYDRVVVYLTYTYEYDAEKFLRVYDGLIAKSILQRNLQEKLTEKGTKSKIKKI